MGKRMLGRRGVAAELYGQRNRPIPFVSLPSSDQENWCREADEFLEAFHQHMATLGWRMVPREMTDEQHKAIVDSPSVRCGEKRGALEIRVAYDHAPEPVEEG